MQRAVEHAVWVPRRQAVPALLPIVRVAGAGATGRAAAVLASLAAAAAAKGLCKDDWVSQAAQQRALLLQKLLGDHPCAGWMQRKGGLPGPAPLSGRAVVGGVCANVAVCRGPVQAFPLATPLPITVPLSRCHPLPVHPLTLTAELANNRRGLRCQARIAEHPLPWAPRSPRSSARVWWLPTSRSGRPSGIWLNPRLQGGAGARQFSASSSTLLKVDYPNHDSAHL